MENILEQLNVILRNLKKSSKRYTQPTIIQKLRTIEDLREDFDELANETKDNEQTVGIKINIKTVYKQLKELLLEQLENNMASFNIETAMKAIPNFTGNYKELDTFIKISELIYRKLDSTGKAELLEFIFHAKLNSLVRTAISSNTTPNSLESLTTLLKERYKSANTIPQIQSQLSNFSQRNLNITAYKDKILNLITELNRLQINMAGSEGTSTITKINEQYSLTVFKNGLNNNYKQTIFAAMPKTFNQAVELAIELEKDNQQTSQIMSLNRNNNNIRRMNGNFNRTGNNNKYSNYSNYNQPNRSYNNNYNPANRAYTNNNYNPTNSSYNIHNKNRINSTSRNNANYSNYNNNNRNNSNNNSRNYNNRNNYRNNNVSNNQQGRPHRIVHIQGNEGDPEEHQYTPPGDQY